MDDDDSEFMSYVMDILKLNKLPNDNYKCLKLFQNIYT